MKPTCCHTNCDEDAQWQIFDGPTPDDYTESCTAHVGELLSDAAEHRVYPIVHPQQEQKGKL